MPALATFSEPEIVAPIDLCTAAGELNRAAVGWSRQPLHRCNLNGHWPRKKRWDFWAVTTDTHMLSVVYGCTDYVGTVAVTWLEYARGTRVEQVRILPLAYGMRFPETVGGGAMRYESRKLMLRLEEEPGGTRIGAAFRSARGDRLEADILVARPPAHESLNVVIPWSSRSFQFTSKQNTRPATGTVLFNGESFRFDHSNQAFGCLDFGRGVWPFQTVWNWGAASGWQDGLLVGLQLGGKWTDGTGMTESALCLNGRLHKVSEPLIWAYDIRDYRRPWRIYAPHERRVDLTFLPLIKVAQRLELGVIGTDLHWVLGHYEGTVVADNGDRIAVANLLGWAEEHVARW